MKPYEIRDELDDTQNDGNPRVGFEVECADIDSLEEKPLPVIDRRQDTQTSQVLKVAQARKTIEAVDGITVACTKKWWESKTIQTALAIIVIGAWDTYAKSHGYAPMPEYVYMALGAVGIITRKNTNAVIR